MYILGVKEPELRIQFLNGLSRCSTGKVERDSSFDPLAADVITKIFKIADSMGFHLYTFGWFISANEEVIRWQWKCVSKWAILLNRDSKGFEQILTVV